MTAATELYEQTSLWSNAFASKDDGLDKPRDILRVAYQAFRERVALLIGQIKTELPNLTLHDITHVDALWRVASEVAGSEYDLNPAEAFVLGGAFLLHDAAHCRAAYKGGLLEIKATNEWRDAAAQRGLADADLQQGTDDFNAVLFDTLRVLHPQQSANLPFAVWGDTPVNAMHLLPHDELRDAYGHAIGEIAKSHWMSPHELEVFANKKLTAPTYLLPAVWTVDWLKIAVLLRVADALHMDAVRAPRFLMQIAPPTDKHSRSHWDFQARMHSIKCDPVREEVVVTSSPFPTSEQTAWWLAYDAARMADRELSATHHLLRDHRLPLFAAREVAGIRSPEMFAKHVPVQGWTPVDTEVRISQVHQLVENFGGAKLYGEKPHLAVRELLQNALDAIHACRKLGGLRELEGEIEVALEPAGEGQQWLHVTDTGIGMSRYVLTHVLLDFGRSLWRSGDLQGEWGQLGITNFEAIGQFGIGFFSVFMLGQQLRITTKRYEAKQGESEHHVLEFTQGIRQRPILREPKPNEKLKRHGSKVSVLVTNELLEKMASKESNGLEAMLGALAPAIDVNLYFGSAQGLRKTIVQANDWKSLTEEALAKRLSHKIVGRTLPMALPYLSPIFGDDELQLGRIGIEDWGSGVGLVQGLYAGKLVGFSGVLQCKSQANLARTDATPNVSWRQITSWARQHQAVLVNKKQLSFTSSAWLAYFDVTQTGLVLGELCYEDVADEELVVWLNSSKEYDELFIYEGDLDFDDDEDIPRSEHMHFSPTSNFMRVCELVIPNWLQLIQPYGKVVHEVGFFAQLGCSPLLESVKATVSKVWGDGCQWTEKDVIIGYIKEHAIERTCLIARRVSPLKI
jgi:hypothetical protein